MKQHATQKLARTLALAMTLAFGASTLLATTEKTKQVALNEVQKVERKKNTAEKGSNRTTRNEAFLVATESRLLSEINKAITYLSGTAAKLRKKSTERLEMREKLLNLRLEAAVYHANEENRQYDKAWEAWDRGGRKGPEPKLSDAKSKGQWVALAEDAKTMLAEYPRAKTADNTLFNMGLAYNFLKKEKDAARIFSQLISQYPNSQKAGDAYFALGDFYFDKTDFRNAQTNYKNALKFRQARSYGWALFKLGWCNYNLQNYRGALAYWKQAVAEQSRVGKKGLALKEESLRDMVFGFAELRQVEPAIAYYRANGGEKFIGKFLILLSQVFSDQGQYGQAIQVLKRYQQVDPTGEEVPNTQKEIISLNFELQRMAAVWVELARFPKLFGPGSRWAEKNKGNKQLYTETQQMIKEQILYYAKIVHKNSQKDDNKKGYVEAIKGYTLYLKSYPKSKEVAEVKYNMADIYYFAKQFKEAGQLYRDICLMGKDKALIYDAKTGKGISIHKDSAEYMLDSYNRKFNAELTKMLKGKPDFEKGAPKPLSEDAKNFIKSCGYYSKWYPNEKKNVKTCDTFIAAIYYQSQDKKMAMKYLWMMAKKYPGTTEGNKAVEDLIPLYGKDKKGLEKAIAELRKIPAYSKGKLGEKLDDLGDGLAIDSITADKNACSRAKKAEEFYKKKPSRKDAPKLVYNAGLDWLKCGKITEAIAAYNIVIKKFPTSEGAQPALLDVAQIEERKLDLGAAASSYYDYAKKYPKDAKAIAALAKSCELQAALNSGSAVATCLTFAATDQNNAKIVFNRMVHAAFSAGDEGRLNSLIATYDGKFKLSPEERIATYALVYNINKGAGGAAASAGSKIMGIFQQAGGNVQGEALRAVGALVFRNVNGALAKFQAMKLKGGTVEALAASKDAKIAAVGQLQAQYAQVLQTKDSFWGVAALYQIGFAFEQLAKDLEDPPEIKGETKDNVAKFLAPQAIQAKGEAKAFYSKALEAVQQMFVYNEWAAKALSGLARINGKNINFDDLIVKPDFLGAEVPENVASALKGG